MTHTGPPKRVVFGPNLEEISDISIGNIIAKGVAIYASKAYGLSHFFPYLDPIHSQLPFKRGDKAILSTPFTYDNVSITVSDSESKLEDPVESVYEIEDEVHSDTDPNLVPTPNCRNSGLQ